MYSKSSIHPITSLSNSKYYIGYNYANTMVVVRKKDEKEPNKEQYDHERFGTYQQ